VIWIFSLVGFVLNFYVSKQILSFSLLFLICVFKEKLFAIREIWYIIAHIQMKENKIILAHRESRSHSFDWFYLMRFKLFFWTVIFYLMDLTKSILKYFQKHAHLLKNKQSWKAEKSNLSFFICSRKNWIVLLI